MLSRRTESATLMIGGALLCAMVAGCAGPVVPSQRLGLARSGLASPAGRQGFLDSGACISCGHRQRLEDAMPYVAGPLVQQDPAAGQAAIQPPHSKFHPVPTRPVFAPRTDPPPQTLRIELPPLTDRGFEFAPAERANGPGFPELDPAPSS